MFCIQVWTLERAGVVDFVACFIPAFIPKILHSCILSFKYAVNYVALTIRSKIHCKNIHRYRSTGNVNSSAGRWPRFIGVTWAPQAEDSTFG